MAEPENKPQAQEQDHEWIIENGKLVKITNANSNGRKCECCGCNCPCRCDCCKKICCTYTKKGRQMKDR